MITINVKRMATSRWERGECNWEGLHLRSSGRVLVRLLFECLLNLLKCEFMFYAFFCTCILFYNKKDLKGELYAN